MFCFRNDLTSNNNNSGGKSNNAVLLGPQLISITCHKQVKIRTPHSHKLGNGSNHNCAQHNNNNNGLRRSHSAPNLLHNWQCKKCTNLNLTATLNCICCENKLDLHNAVHMICLECEETECCRHCCKTKSTRKGILANKMTPIEQPFLTYLKNGDKKANERQKLLPSCDPQMKCSCNCRYTKLTSVVPMTKQYYNSTANYYIQDVANRSDQNRSPKRHHVSDLFSQPKVSRSVSNDSMLCHSQQRVPFSTNRSSKNNLVTSFYDLTVCHPIKSQYTQSSSMNNTPSRFTSGACTIDRRHRIPNAMSKKLMLWSCVNCTLENSQDLTVCIACDTPRLQINHISSSGSSSKLSIAPDALSLDDTCLVTNTSRRSSACTVSPVSAKPYYYRRSLSESPSTVDHGKSNSLLFTNPKLKFQDQPDLICHFSDSYLFC